MCVPKQEFGNEILTRCLKGGHMKFAFHLIGVFLLGISADTRADDWYAWRGPHQNGTAPHANPPTTWDESTNIKWKIKIPGEGSATPIVWEKRIFVQTAIPTGKKGEAPAAAANVDTALLVAALNADFNPRRLERYLAVAWQSGARPVVVLTKADLSADVDAAVAAMQGVAFGVDVLAVSAATGEAGSGSAATSGAAASMGASMGVGLGAGGVDSNDGV